jgi:very-short-patch-repair endonuclease
MRSRLMALARRLRRTSTDAENALWRHLRAKKLEGLKFRRQHPIGSHIVDFVCLDRRVVIELDGGQHAEQEHAEKDRARDQWLPEEGYAVLRFWDFQVFENTEGVLEVIRDTCLKGRPAGRGDSAE